METSSVSKIYSLNKSTYINLRWIGIIGQFLTINIVYFIFKFDFAVNGFIKYYITLIFIGHRSFLINNRTRAGFFSIFSPYSIKSIPRGTYFSISLRSRH